MADNNNEFTYEDFEKGLMLSGILAPKNQEDVRDLKAYNMTKSKGERVSTPETKSQHPDISNGVNQRQA